MSSNDDGCDKSHILISYNWTHQTIALSLLRHLREDGYNVTIDIEYMKDGSSLESMATAVANASVVMILVSSSYKNSANCRMEAEYSASLSKTFLMVNVEESYKPDGWLAFLQAKSSSLSIYEDDQVERSFADLKKLLGEQSRNKESLAKAEESKKKKKATQEESSSSRASKRTGRSSTLKGAVKEKTKDTEKAVERPRSNTGKRETLERAKLYEETRHVMISYQWDTKPTMLRVRDKLLHSGYKVWMDVDNMAGSLSAAMAAAVEKAAVVLVCVSEKYKASKNCHKEADYAFQLDREVIPLMMQSGYKPDGWLGILCGNQLHFSFAKPAHFDSSVTDLIKELGKRGKLPEGITPAQYNDYVDKSDVNSQATSRPPDNHVIGWDNKKVNDWLTENDLTKYKAKFVGFDGPHILQYRRIQQQAPEFFFADLRDLSMARLDIIKFTMALDKLL